MQEGGHAGQPVRLDAEVSRGPVAHFGGRDQHVGGLRQRRLNAAFAQAAAVFADHVSRHGPSFAQVLGKLGFEGGAGLRVVGQIQHHRVALGGRPGLGVRRVPRQHGQALREQFSVNEFGMLGFPGGSGGGHGFSCVGPKFGQQHAAALGVDVQGVQGAVRQGRHGFLDGRDRISRKQQDVVAGLQSVSDAPPLARKVRKPFHAHGVCERQPLEAHLLTQQGVDNRWGKGGGLGFGAVQARHVQVGDHHPAHAMVKGVLERSQLHRVQPCPIVQNGRQCGVRVAVAVAMSWKMLGGGQHPLVLKAVGVGLPQLGHPLHGLAEASAANHRVDRVGVDVHHRGEVDVDARGAKALPHHLPKHSDQFLVARGAQRHGPRKRARAVETHAQPPFGVGGHHQGHGGQILQSLQSHALVVGAALHANHATQPEVSGPSLGLCPACGVGSGVDGDHEQLSHALFHGQRGHQAVHDIHGAVQKRRWLWGRSLGRVLAKMAAPKGKQRPKGQGKPGHQVRSAMRVRARESKKLNCSSTVKSLLSTTTASSAWRRGATARSESMRSRLRTLSKTSP